MRAGVSRVVHGQGILHRRYLSADHLCTDRRVHSNLPELIYNTNEDTMDQNAINVAAHLELLGQVMEDRVTGIKGMVDSVCFDAYGCVQASLRPRATKDGELKDGRWFDVKRLKKAGDRLMPVPVIPPAGKENGPADKPPRGA